MRNRADKILVLALWTWTAAAAEQPIAYSHKLHVAGGLACLDCHSTADTGAAATIPSVQKCMLCHGKVGVDKPEIKKIAGLNILRVLSEAEKVAAKLRSSP